MIGPSGAIENLASQHGQINSYGTGDPWEWASSGTVGYPAVFTTIDGASINKGDKVYSIAILVMDIPRTGEADELEIMSDLALICEDIISYLRHPDFPFQIQENVDMEDFTEDLKDKVSGWKMTINFRSKMENDRCAFPGTISINTLNSER